MKTTSGFSLIELLVAATIMLSVLTMVYTAFIQTRKISMRHQMDTEITQNARIGLDELTRTLRMIGYHRDWERGQPALIEAAPFQIIFNANLYQYRDFSSLPEKQIVKLYDGKNYSPLQNYSTNAETIRWTLDRSNDGLVDREDTKEDSKYILTPWNPDDMVLIKEINGENNMQVTFSVVGPYDAKDQPTNITPLFQYWLFDPTNSFTLLGDENNDKRLEGQEQYFRAITSQDILQKIRRVQITITTESDRKDPFMTKQHRRVSLSSEIGLRD